MPKPNNISNNKLEELLNISLNDAAALLIQIEPGDVSELTRLQEMLGKISENASHTDAFRENIIQAVQKIEEVIDESVSDPDSALMEIGKLIETAMHQMEEVHLMSDSADSTLNQDDHPENDPIEKDAADSIAEDEITDDAGSADESESFSDADISSRSQAPAWERDEISDNYDDKDAQDSDETTIEAQKNQNIPFDTAEESLEDYMPENIDPELMGAFITESSDLISNAEEALLMLENNPDDMDAVSIVFRAFHTIKGTSAFLELSLVSELAHHAESLLSRVRDREIRYGGGYADLSLRSVDIIKELLQLVQSALNGGSFPKPRGYDELMLLLADPEKAVSNITVQPSAEESEPIDMPEDNAEAEDETAETETEDETAETETEDETAETETEDETAETEITDTKPGIQKPVPPRKPETPSMADIAQDFRKTPRPEVRQITESSIRVPIDRLDRFIDMVGELVVAHSMVAQDQVVSSGTNHELVKKVTHTGKIVRELQSMSMSMRMIPLRSTFQKMARLVRDLARKAGKQIRFVAEGDDTEIDRNMVDYINDPLVHMVRNAVDHGIELPEIRKKAGKQPQGTVKISACHSAGNVVVEIEDDGKGLDSEAILNKATERGLISADDIEKGLSDRDVFSLVFEPGFSTAEIVSDISGRGVGMDVVKTNIESLRGQVDIQSEWGKGTIFKMSLPLTLAIIDGMVLRVGTERYVMPTISIVRSVQPDPEDISTVLHRGEMLSLQGRLIPLFRLDKLFHVQGSEQNLSRAIVMIVEDDGRQAGLIIDELIGTQQIVIKTLGETMRNIPGISGSAIMPDGRVGLILDVSGLVRLANQGIRNRELRTGN